VDPVLALSAREWNALIVGIVSVLLALVILAYPPALRIIVAAWLLLAGLGSILWALSD
jgi:uncharacterized membrane protein HdeD (DUF308 family)